MLQESLVKGASLKEKRDKIDSVPEVEVLLGSAGEGIHVCQQVCLCHPLGAESLVSLPDSCGVVETCHHRVHEVTAVNRLLHCQLALKSQKVN